MRGTRALMTMTMAVAGALAAGAAPAGAAAPRGRISAVQAGHYAGHGGKRTYTSLVVSPTGRDVTAFTFQYRHGTCSDGQPFGSGEGNRRLTIPISASGRLSYSHTYRQAYEVDRHNRRVTGTERLQLALVFAGTHVGGVLHDTFRGRRMRCATGPVSVSADLEGTPRAPLEKWDTMSGRYSALGADNSRIVVDAFVPWEAVTEFWITSHESFCTNGWHEGGNDRWHLAMIPTHGAHVSYSGQATTSGRGLAERHRLQLIGQFDVLPAMPPRFVFSGQWRDTAQIFRHGRRVGTCTTQTIAFTVNGPGRPVLDPLDRRGL